MSGTPTLRCKGTLADLPVFKGRPVADKHHDHPPIFEFVTLTHKTTPQTNPPYKLQEHGGIIGRNEPCSEVYLAARTMERRSGIFAFPEVTMISVDTLESYIIPGEQSYRELHL